MELNGKLSQRCWQEVLGCSSTKARLKSRKKHCVLDDSFGSQSSILYCPFITSMSGAN